MTPSQAKSSSAPEAIEDQQQSGGSPRPLSLIRGTLRPSVPVVASLSPRPNGPNRAGPGMQTHVLLRLLGVLRVQVGHWPLSLRDRGVAAVPSQPPKPCPHMANDAGRGGRINEADE